MAFSQDKLEAHRKRLKILEADLCAQELRISAYHDLPFAIYRYDPDLEYQVRDEVKRLATRIANSTGKNVVTISLADLLFEAVENTVGFDAIIEAERGFGFAKAQETITQILSNPDFCELPRMVEKRLQPLDPAKHFAFLLRAASMAPAIYQLSNLLAQMQGRTRVPSVLFYPGTLVGISGLQFMGMADRQAVGSYRVKIY